jgi:hypothetical protein
MGMLDSKANTFWQLVTHSGASPWTLVTPPGIATNGGIAVSMPSATTIVAAVLPAELLKFTGLARSDDAGRTWAPGVVDEGLDPVPDAIGASTGSLSVALLSGHTGSVDVARTSLFDWSRLANRATIAGSVVGCRLSSLSAVAIGSGTPLVAGSCTSDSVPVFEQVDHGWKLVGPSLGARSSIDVLRLVGTSTGAVCLVKARVGSHAALLAITSTDRFASWRVSSLGFAKGTVTSTSVTAGGAASVLVTEPGGSSRAFATRGPGLAWTDLPPLPHGAALVTAASVGTIEVLAVNRSVLTVYAPREGSWAVVQRLVVPIQYGSSS